MTTDSKNAPAVILVVESEVLSHMVLTDMLADEGHCVIDARNSQDALALLESRSDVQVVLMGRRTPGEIDGLTLAQIVRKRWPEIGIIVTSGSRLSAHELPSGARFLPKPYSYQALLGALSSVLPEKVSAAPLLPEGLPPWTGVGEAIQIAAAAAEPDKT